MLMMALISCHKPSAPLPELQISEQVEFVIDTLLTGLQNPGGIDWVNDSLMVFSERGDGLQPLNLWYVDTQHAIPI